MRVAILGVWHVHAPSYTKRALELGEVVGFFERNDAFAEAYAASFPDIPRFGDLDALLASDAEGVIVCSASCDHAEDIVRAARAGKQIFTEKVLALTSAECDACAEAIAESGVSFTISLFQKYLGSRMAVMEVARSGELGKLNLVRFRNCHGGSLADWLPPHFYDPRECGGGAMIDLGAHGMYLIHELLGLPEEAASAFGLACEKPEVLAKNPDRVEDNAVTVMRFSDGAVAVNETGFLSMVAPVVFEVHGENGYVRMEDNSVIKRTVATGNRHVAVEVPPSLPSPLDQFLLGEHLPGCGIEEAVALTKMMEMAYA